MSLEMNASNEQLKIDSVENQLEKSPQELEKFANEMLSQAEKLFREGNLTDSEYDFISKKIEASRTQPTFDNTTLIQRVLDRRIKKTLTTH